jgi:uncharacterized protein involved in oxidation of intracellular sulfur
MKMSEKYLVNCSFGSDDPERATIAFILAFTSSKTNETAVFVTAEASYLLIKGEAEKVNAKGYEPIKNLIEGFVDNGGVIWLCPACVKAKGINENDLISGVEIAGAPKTMAYLASGAKTIL